MTFQEVIDLGEGEGTIELAQSSLEKVQNLMSNTLHIEDIYIPMNIVVIMMIL